MSLKKQLEDILCNLNKAYQKLDYNKETLNQQSENVKEQIRNNIIMQVDALNQRKQWLLNQLELVKSDKMESIHRKQDAIKCSLSNIQKLLSDPPKYSNSQIKESFESINSLMSEETRPFIAFRSDPALLREIISQYGVILKQYCGHFADPTRPSISLPSVVEEEDDEDSLTYTRKDEATKNEENNVLRVSTYPVSSSIVRAWLRTTNDFANNIDVEVGPPKSDCDSFIRVGSIEGMEMKSQKSSSPSDHSKGSKEMWLSNKSRSIIKSDYSDILRPFVDIKNQNNCLWLSEPNGMDEDKDVDHCDLIKKACTVGNCKSFRDCCEIENCCNKLIDPARPSWNKWLLDNNVFKAELLSHQVSATNQENNFSNEFIKILKSDNEKWLQPRKCAVKSVLKRPNENSNTTKDEEMEHCSSVTHKWARINSDSRGSVFDEPLEKWIRLGREMEWKNNKGGMIDSVNKSVENMTLDELDGLINGSNDGETIKWLIDRQMNQ